MNPHAHICLCDEKWIFYYDHVEFDLTASVPMFLDLIFNMFNPESISRESVEAGMYERLDQNSSSPIYFKSKDLLYMWIQCTGCHLAGLN